MFVNRSTDVRGGWRIARSIAIELDVAAYFVRMGPEALPPTHAELANLIPPEWFDEFDALSSAAPSKRGLQSIVEILARWAGVLEVEDYDIASAAMRELTVEGAISQILEVSDLVPDEQLSPTDSLVDLQRRLDADLFARIGMYPASDQTLTRRNDQAIAVAVDALCGQPLHGRFWHWMDRFYYQAYAPWRATRNDEMDALEQTAIDALGASHGSGAPRLDWLDSTNPIVSTPAMRAGVEAGDIDVVFWTEPFGLSETWTSTPGTVITSYAERGNLYEHYTATLEALTSKLRAVSDPTRMSILRIIRMHDVDNTQLAGHLDVSRPTVSVHAKVLADAGLITTTREGRQARHALQPAAVKQLCDDLLRFLDIPEHLL
jgi:ArsR family transcriptional regulator